MQSLRRNVLANFAGGSWLAVLGFICAPLFLKALGAEGYGLVGFYSVLATTLSLLDGGFSAATAREVSKDPANPPIDTIFTLERLLFLGAVVLSALMYLLSGWISSTWLTRVAQSPEAVRTAVSLMGIALSLQWISSFYSGLLGAMQQQVLQNQVNAAIGTLRSLGSVAVLFAVSPTAVAFFSFQVVVSVLHIAVLRSSLQGTIRRSGTARFDLGTLSPLKGFAAGVVSIYVLQVALTQFDKILLSKLLRLDDFGHYMLAWSLAAVALRISGPVYNALHPRLTQLRAEGNESVQGATYMRAGQVVALLLLPVSMLVIFFGDVVLYVWTTGSAGGAQLWAIAAALSAGSMITGVMSTPGAMMIAAGRMRAPLWASVALVAIQLPLVYVSTVTYGVVGAALASLVLVLGYNASIAFVTNDLVPRNIRNQWYFQNFAMPVLALVVVYGACRLLFDETSPKGLVRNGVSLMIAYLAGLSAIALLPPYRSALADRIIRRDRK